MQTIPEVAGSEFTLQTSVDPVMPSASDFDVSDLN